MEEQAMIMMMNGEDRFRAMAGDGVDRWFDENLPIFRSELANRLSEMERQMEHPPEQRNHLSAFSQLDWAEGLEDTTVNFIKFMAGHMDCCRRGAAHFAAKEPALAETLRGIAAWSDATRAEVEEIAAGARRLRGMCLRTVSGASEEDIVCTAAEKYLAHVATDAPHDGDSTPQFPYEAVVDQVEEAVAVGARAPGFKRFLMGFAERAGRLTRAAEDLGDDEAVKLRAHAAAMESLCADTEAFLQKMVSSPYWMFWRYLIGRDPKAQTPMDE